MGSLSKFLSDNSVLGERKRLVFVLLVSLLNGLLYIFIVPPWQHHDEPQHFEYVWLLYDQNKLPQPDDFDQEMRRATAMSMLDHGFFYNLGIQPDLDAVDTPIWIGSYSQLTNQPLYYMLASIPATLLDIEDVTRQLYSARLVSLILLLVTIVAAWGVASEITPRAHPLRLYLPLTMALFPSFVDLMTSINNDVAAVAFVSLTLWGSIHLVKRGFSIKVFLGTIVAVLASYYSKEVAIVSLLIFVLAIMFMIFRNGMERIAWVVLFLILGVSIIFVFVWDDPASWYRSISQEDPLRIQDDHAPLGDYIFVLDLSYERTPGWMFPTFQPIPREIYEDHINPTISLGAWIWSDRPARILSPILSDGDRYYYEKIEITTEPKYYVANIDLIQTPVKRLWVSLAPWIGKQTQDLRVYYDGIVLTQGKISTTEPPYFDDIEGATGMWEGESFINYLRNGSAEVGGIRLRSDFDNLLTKFLPARASLLLTSILDPSGAGWIFKASGLRIFRTFWGKFGWGNVPLIGGKPYRVFGLLSMLAIIGFGIWIAHLILRKRILRHANYSVILFSLFILIWFGAMTRGTLHLGVLQMYLPVARYAAPAIIPTLLILTIGWLEVLSIIIRWLRVRPNLQEPVRFVVYFAVFVIFDLYALYSILSFYSRTVL